MKTKLSFVFIAFVEVCFLDLVQSRVVEKGSVDLPSLFVQKPIALQNAHEASRLASENKAFFASCSNRR